MTEEQYDRVCRGRFDSMAEAQKTTNEKLDHISTRLFVSNGKRALVEMQRDNAQEILRVKAEAVKSHDAMKALMADVSAIKKQVVPEAGLELSHKGIVIKGMKSGDIPKILLLVVILAYLIFRDHGADIITKVTG